MNIDISKNDLLNRFASHTFTETADSPTTGRTKIEFKNGSSVVIAEQNFITADTFKKAVMYFRIREELVGGIEIPLLSTETQRDALTGIIKGQSILVDRGSGVHVQQFHDGTSWKTITHT